MELSIGGRLRVTAPTVWAGAPQTATLIGLDDASLTLRVARHPDPVVLPRDAVTRIEVGARQHSRGRGAAIGAGVGIAAGAIVGLASGDDSGLIKITAGEKAIGFGVLLGAVGALVGVAIPPGEKWIEPPLGRARVSVSTTLQRGVGLGLVVAF